MGEGRCRGTLSEQTPVSRHEILKVRDEKSPEVPSAAPARSLSPSHRTQLAVLCGTSADISLPCTPGYKL